MQTEGISDRENTDSYPTEITMREMAAPKHNLFIFLTFGMNIWGFNMLNIFKNC